ncbi:MAG TPA: MFS transporter [Bacteroidota bacterium]
MTNAPQPPPSSVGQDSASRGRIVAWTLFDFANTAFYVLILTVGYPLYFKKVVSADSLQGDALWGIAFSISMFIVALLSPVLGAVADYGAGKKRFLGIFTAVCLAATAGLFFVHESMILWGIILLVFANIGFEAGLVFYDAFLPEITTERSYGRVSGYGFAVGYVGSLVTLFAALPLYAGGFEPANLLNVRLSFVMAAVFFFVFAIPLFVFVPDRQRFAPLKLNFAKIGFERLRNTAQQFPAYRNVAKFLLSYFIYIDAINTIIVFSSIFADETLHLTTMEIIYFFIIVQTSAIVGSIAFGLLADKLGHKQTLTFSLLIWVVIVVIAYFTADKTTFFIVGVLAGIALGSSQSSSRSLMSTLVPPEKKTEFFGFYSFFGKASAILGPALFGILSSNFNQRIAILAIGGLLVVGLVLLQRVEVTRAKPSS